MPGSWEWSWESEEPYEEEEFLEDDWNEDDEEVDLDTLLNELVA